MKDGAGRDSDEPARRPQDATLVWGRLLAVGPEFAVTVVAGVMSGYYLDTWLGSAPWLTLLLTLAGMGGALYRLLWNLKQIRSYRDGPPDGRNGA